MLSEKCNIHSVLLLVFLLDINIELKGNEDVDGGQHQNENAFIVMRSERRVSVLLHASD